MLVVRYGFILRTKLFLMGEDVVTRIPVFLDRVVGGEKIPIFGVSSALRVKRTRKTDSARENGQK